MTKRLRLYTSPIQRLQRSLRLVTAMIEDYTNLDDEVDSKEYFTMRLDHIALSLDSCALLLEDVRQNQRNATHGPQSVES